ncbi:MAG: hypothetical protein EKK40_07100 [Bradyrhizobiaceae bacterium]|nr:MAG: hypothetical protein EKK40_07100 [Bradyrhizobiaceae bacterium]
MARIRTIKPEFFRHEVLYEAEREENLPLRLAYAGLWTACDREGRFAWSPRALKLDCLPYDDVDFSRVLDALASRGFVLKYEVDGKEYGCIPSWGDHQIINNREQESKLPPINENNILTREPRVDDACGTPLKRAQGEGKGKELEGKGKEETRASALLPAEPEPALDDWPADYRIQFWTKYPHKVGKPKALLKLDRIRLRGVSWRELMDGLDRYMRTKPPDRPWLNPETFINQERWTDQPAEIANGKSESLASIAQRQAAAGISFGPRPGGLRVVESRDDVRMLPQAGSE